MVMVCGDCNAIDLVTVMKCGWLLFYYGGPTYCKVPIRFGRSAIVNNILHDPKSQRFESSRSINIQLSS